jgi:5-formyltetrahydrofolate cyclo-ligase
MAAPHTSPIMTQPARDAAKRAARLAARALRAGHDPALGACLAEHLLRELPPPPGAIVGGFWPLPDEIDIVPLLRALDGRGHAIGLPETPPPGAPLLFRRWRPDAPMHPGRFGTLVPDGPPIAPNWLLVPLLAYDDAGNRLGFGGGYYDRTIAASPAMPLIGCAFAAQRLDAVPVGPYDAPLTALATEAGVIRFPRTQG